MIFSPSQIHLFVNAIVQPGGFLQVAVLDVETQLPLADFPLNGSSLAGMPPSTAIEVTDQVNPPPFDSTLASITWPYTAENLSSVAGRPVRLQFRMNLASLYSFWTSRTKCGESGGFLGAGGPGAVKGVDVAGGCASNRRMTFGRFL